IVRGLALDDTVTILAGAAPAALMALAFHALFELLDRVVIPRGLRSRRCGRAGAPPRSGRRLEQRVEPPAEGEDLGVVGREPRAEPLGAVQERERSLARPADGDAPHQPARVDEAHLVEQAARRGDAGG